MTVFIGNAVIPSTDSVQIEGANCMFLIEGNLRGRSHVEEGRNNLELIKQGSLYRCSFTTNVGEEIKVREEEMKVSELKVAEARSGSEPQLSFRVLLIPQDVTANPSEFV